ncbi:hypothetical protein FRC04_009870, partial [Tulasnella sp. 424]
PLDDPTPKVLKEVWLDSDSKTEGQNLDAIFERLQEIAAEGDEGIFKGFNKKSKKSLKRCLKAKSWGRYFLTKVCDWQGCESKEVPPAAHSDPTLFDSPTSTITPSSIPHSDRTRTTTYQATNPVPVAQNRLPRRHCPKRQYRVIFEEVCEALHDVQRLRDVATALLDSVFALQLMFLAGWVHRDISSGNIYAYRFQKSGTKKVKVQGILADLEYAKRFEPELAEGSSDPKTGTAFFMAVEIQKQVLFYNLDASQSNHSLAKGRNKELDNNEEEESEEKEYEEGLSEESSSESSSSSEESSEEEASESNLKRSIDVIHNFEHDMESIFWLYLWILLLVKRLRKARKALLRGYYRRAFNFDDRASYAPLYRPVSKMLKSCRRVAKKLGPGSSMQGLTPGSVHPAHVIKRKANVGGGDGNKSSSKVGRVEGSTDAASSRTLHQQNPEVSEHEESGQSAKTG